MAYRVLGSLSDADDAVQEAWLRLSRSDTRTRNTPDPWMTHAGAMLAGMIFPPAQCAHLLLQADPGRADDVASFVATLPSVTEAAVTSGPYDVIARVDLTGGDLSRVLVRARRAPGLCGVWVCRPA